MPPAEQDDPLSPHPSAAASMQSATVAPLRRRARFVTGSTMRHVVVMTATSSIGLMALFLVDLVDMYFLGLLGERLEQDLQVLLRVAEGELALLER